MIDEKKLERGDLCNFCEGADCITCFSEEAFEKWIDEQPKVGEWIPCSERLPEAGQRYLVTAIWKDKGYGMRRTYDAVYGYDGVWHTYNYEPMNCEVTAWMPLPEPWEGEEVEEQ